LKKQQKYPLKEAEKLSWAGYSASPPRFLVCCLVSRRELQRQVEDKSGGPIKQCLTGFRMARIEKNMSTELLTGFTDVLYLTDQENIPGWLQKFFRQKKLSYLLLPVCKFSDIAHRLGLIGTVVIDVQDREIAGPRKLAKIIGQLEQNGIGVILLSAQPQINDKADDVLSSNKGSAGKKSSINPDELWVRISVNLAYRKKSPGMVVKPATPPRETVKTFSNRLSDQLTVTGALVDNLSEQLRLAGLVQRDFLPSQLPSTDRFRWEACFLPTEWVSGDIYDISRLDEQHIGFYVADVVGHSMPAALLTIFLKQALVMRETLGDDYRIFPPAEVVHNLNLRMAGQKLSGYQFATCCYCLLNTETLELTYARAGHPYPILIRPGQVPRQLEIRGSLLGIFGQALYKQQSIKLQSGDKLLLYSDGADPFIGSFDDKKGFIFTEQFLQASRLPIDEMFEMLNTLAQQQQKDTLEIDDITMVGLEVT